MKKRLLLNRMIMVILFAGLSLTGWSQLLYEGFEYATPAFIGGNGDAGSTSNNWTTHSVTAGQTTTIDVQDGSLSYTGLKSSLGNKVYLFSGGTVTTRDVNRGFTSTAMVMYYSALVNIIDNTQLTALDNYFMHFGAAQGAVNTTFGGRLGAKIATANTNFRFIIANNSGGTSVVYSDNGADLNFGTTYLVVVKYDISAPLTVATMWVNPTSLGGAEPAGGITNNTGTNAFANFSTGSICLRNNQTTPKANIDEIRVGTTWADVTPIAGVGFGENETAKNVSSVYPNPCNAMFYAQTPDKGKFKLTISNALGSTVKSFDSIDKTTKVETNNLTSGLYFVTFTNLANGSREVHKLIVK